MPPAADFSTLLWADIRRTLRWPNVVGAFIIAVLPLLNLATTIGSFLVRGSLDVYAVAMTSPALLVFPLLCVLITALPTYEEVGNRYLSMLQTRTQLRAYFASRLLVTASLAAVVFFLFAFLPFVAAFWVWPAIGNPSVDLAAYNMTPDQLAVETYTDTTFTQLFRLGPAAFGVGYSFWVALNGALFSSAGVLCLLLLRNRVLALAVPFLCYFTQTLFAALFGMEHSALMYAVFPFGLTQASVWLAVTPTLVLTVIIAGCWWRVLRKAQYVPGAA